MMQIRKIILTITMIATIFPAFSVAQTKVINGTSITKNTVWRGTIHIKGDVVVKKNAKLIIEGGTKIIFEPNKDLAKAGKDKTKSEIIVEGILDVQGDINNKVVFTSASKKPRMGDWYGVTIINSSLASIIEYAVFEYAYNAISTKRSRPKIRKCQIRYNYNAGLLFEVKSNPEVIENIVSENGYAGIICKLGSKPILSGNLIALNQVGVVAFSMSSPNLGRVKKGKNYNIGMNDIRDNEEYNIYNHSSSIIYAENNTWESTSISKINKRNFGNKQNSKYGDVKVEPLLQTEQNKASLRELAQQSPAPTNTTTAAPAPSANSTVKKNETKASTVAATTALVSNNIKPTDKVSSQKDSNPTKSAVAEKEAKPVPKEKVAAKPVVIAETKKEIKEEAPKIDYNQIFLEPLLDTKKREVVKKASPKITDAMRRIPVSGRVIVRVIVDKNGKVEDAQILRGINELYDEKCIETSKKFVFKQGTVEGVPVRFSTNLFFRFDKSR